MPADQPIVAVTLDESSPDPQTAALRQAFAQVPIPPGARPATGTDESMVVTQPSRDRMWEFWGAALQADDWHARWGGRVERLSSNPGYYTDYSQWGTTATSLPVLGGLIRISELAAGHIDHALYLAIPQVRAGTFGRLLRGGGPHADPPRPVQRSQWVLRRPVPLHAAGAVPLVPPSGSGCAWPARRCRRADRDQTPDPVSEVHAFVQAGTAWVIRRTVAFPPS